MSNVVQEEKLYIEIIELVKNAKESLKTAINLSMVYTYYEIGKRIFLEDQNGKERAGYGKFLLKNLSKSYL